MVFHILKYQRRYGVCLKDILQIKGKNKWYVVIVSLMHYRKESHRVNSVLSFVPLFVYLPNLFIVVLKPTYD